MSMYLVASAGPPSQSIFARRFQSPFFVPQGNCLMAESSPKSSVPSTDTPTLSLAGGESVSSASFAKPSNPPKRSSSRRESSNDPSPRPGKRLRPNPTPMTAAAALQGKQRAEKSRTPSTETSLNPAKQALSALMGVDNGATSPVKNSALQPATTISEPLTVVAENIQEKPNETH